MVPHGWKRAHLSPGITHVESSGDFIGTGVAGDVLGAEVTLARMLDLGASPTQTGAMFAYAAPAMGYTAGGFLTSGQFVQFEVGTVSSPDDSDVIIRVGTDDYTLVALGGLAVKLFEVVDDTKYLAFGKGDVLLLLGPTDGSGRVVDITESGLPPADADAIGKIFTNRLIPAAWMVHEVRHAVTPVMGSFGSYTSPRNTADTFDLYRGTHGSDPTTVRVGSVDQNIDSRHVGVFYWNWRDAGFRIWTTHVTSAGTTEYRWAVVHLPADRLVSGGTGEYIGHGTADADLLRHMPQDSIDIARTYVGVATDLNGDGVAHVRTFDNSSYVAAVTPFNVYDFVTIGLYGTGGNAGQTLAQVHATIDAALNTLVSTIDGAGLTNSGTTQAPVLDVDPTQADFPTIPLDKGGTGATDAAAARTALGIIASYIKTQYESNNDTNAFTDALLTKVNSVEDDAKDDQTGAEIVTLLEALAGVGQLNATALRLIADAIDAELGSTTWRTGGSGGGSSTFLDLTDTPVAFGTAGQVAAVNSAADALEFVNQAGGFSVTNLFSGNIDITTANQWKALGTTAVPSDATWLLWNGGAGSDGTDDGSAALWTWINAADWRALTADTEDTTPGDGTGMLMVDWIATNIGDGTPDFARRDAVIGRTSANIPLITSTNDGEDFFGASLKYITAGAGGGSGGFTQRYAAGTPADSLGDDGDWYLNTTNGAWFTKSSGSWGSAVYTDMVGSGGGASSFADLTGMIADSQVPAAFTRDTELAAYAALVGATFTGAVAGITPTADAHLSRKDYVDTADALALKIAQNLADLANVTTARTNLGLGTAATRNTGDAENNLALLGSGGAFATARIPNLGAIYAAFADGGTFAAHLGGITPTADAHFTTKSYVDGLVNPVQAHTNYAALKTTNTFLPADFTAAGSSASSTTSDITVPAFVVDSYLAFAIPDSQSDLTDIRETGSAFSSFSSFERVSGTITIGGEAHKVWRSTIEFLANSNAQSWTIT